ncbi:MAG: hypothetical protein ACYDH1_01595 [Anaerolineaceae bacterium]
MNDLEIDNQIKLAVSLKHQGLIKQALVMEENCLKMCLLDKDTTHNGYGIIYKAIGKSYFLNRDFENAKQSYINAILHFGKADKLMAISECFFHLGCCGDKFLKSGLFFDDYYNGLQKGDGKRPGEPGSVIPKKMVDELAQIGINMFQNHNKKRKKFIFF